MRLQQSLRPLPLILAIGGGSAVLIGLMLIFFGPHFVPGAGPVNATIDSEMRFYAALFVAYGGVMLWCLANTGQKHRTIQVLAGVLFAGGVGRLCSMMAVGLPSLFFVVMTLLELGLPPVVFWLLRRARPVAA